MPTGGTREPVSLEISTGFNRYGEPDTVRVRAPAHHSHARVCPTPPPAPAQLRADPQRQQQTQHKTDKGDGRDKGTGDKQETMGRTASAGAHRRRRGGVIDGLYRAGRACGQEQRSHRRRRAGSVGAYFRTPAGKTTVERTCGIAVPTLAATVTSLVSGDDSGNDNNQNRSNNQNQNDGNGQGDGQQPNDPQPTLTPEADPIPENPTTRQYGSEFQRWNEPSRNTSRTRSATPTARPQQTLGSKAAANVAGPRTSTTADERRGLP